MNKDLVVQKVMIDVECPLHSDQIEHRGARIAQLMYTRTEEEASVKAKIKELKKGLAKLDSEIDQLAREIRAESFTRTVEAERRPHFETNTWRTVRVDPDGYGIVVSEEAMTAEERQLAIDVGEAPDKAEQSAAKPKKRRSAEAAAH